MIKIAYFHGGKDGNGNRHFEYKSPEDKKGMSEEKVIRDLQVAVDYEGNPRICKPGETKKGLICILSEDELKKIVGSL